MLQVQILLLHRNKKNDSLKVKLTTHNGLIRVQFSVILILLYIYQSGEIGRHVIVKL